MRTFGLANLAYGTLGVLSATFLQRVDGIAVSFWVMGVGAAGFLEIAPSPLALVRMMIRH
jgi:hypothetical protein